MEASVAVLMKSEPAEEELTSENLQDRELGVSGGQVQTE
jgi:hypothetical protein